jgi:hypothetical protein
VVVLPDDTFPSLKHKKYVLAVTDGYIRAHNSIYSTTGPITYMTILDVLSMDTSLYCKYSGHRPSLEVASLNRRPETFHFTCAPTHGNCVMGSHGRVVWYVVTDVVQGQLSAHLYTYSRGDRLESRRQRISGLRI